MRERDSRSARRMDWSVQDWPRRVVGQSKKRGKRCGTRTAAVQTAAERVRQRDPPDWSIRGGMKHGASPRTGSSGGEPGATDWSVRGNGENTIKRRPGLEHPGRKEARH